MYIRVYGPLILMGLYTLHNEGENMANKKKNVKVKEVEITDLMLIIEMINKTDETSAPKCYETINRIKDLWGEEE